MRVYQTKNIMAGISCFVPLDDASKKQVAKLAKNLEWSETETGNAIGAWQTANNKLDKIPSAKELKEFIGRLRKNEGMIGTAEVSPRQKMINSYDPLILQDRLNYMPKIFTDALVKVNSNYAKILKERIEEEEDEARQNVMIDEVNAINNAIWKHNWSNLARRVRISNVVKTMKDIIQERTQSEYTSDSHYRNEHKKILEHFDALFEESFPLIEQRIHLKIQINQNANEEESDWQDKDEKNNGDDETGQRADSNNFLFYKVREIELRSTLSQKIQDFIRGIPQMYANGRPVMDDIRFLNEGYVYRVLQNGLSWMTNPDDFAIKNSKGKYTFPALEKLMGQKSEYKWIRPLMNQLNMHPELVPQFYTGFRQEFIPQTMMSTTRTGKFLPTRLNSAELTTQGIKILIRNYENGILLDPKNSIWDRNRKINRKNIEKLNDLLDKIDENLDNYETDKISKDEKEKIANELIDQYADALRRIGIEANRDFLTEWITRANVQDMNILNGIIKDIDALIKRISESKGYLMSDANIMGIYEGLSEPVMQIDETDRNSSFYQTGKMYQSYCLPSYTDTFLKRLRNPETRKQVLEELKQDPFLFYNGKWMNSILQRIAEHPEDENFYWGLMDSTMMKFIDRKPYEEWTEADIIQSFISFYFTKGYNRTRGEQFAWYNFPIMSDIKTAQFICLPRYIDKSHLALKGKSLEEQMLPLYRNIVYQELIRMGRIEEREKAGAIPIQSYDERGKKFCFFPELNHTITYQENGQKITKQFKDRLIELKERGDKESIDRTIDDVIKYLLNKKTQEMISKINEVLFDENFGQNRLEQILIADEVLSDPDDSSKTGFTYMANYEQAIKEYVWNSTYATSQIIQLLAGDLAFYKNDQDFQKRFKQMYASGRKLFTNSVKYGKKFDVTITLKDFIRPSSTYAQIRKTFLDGVEKGLLSKEEAESFISEFENIDATDGQGLRTLESMRSILDMLGELTPELENTINRIINRENTPQDTRRFIQVIKPFFFSNIMESDGIGGQLRTPVQQKNSEAVLLAIYDTLGGPKAPSNVRGLNQFMKDHGIDAAQFESAVKIGSKAPIDLNWSEKKFTELKKELELDPEWDREDFMEALRNDVQNGILTQDEVNDYMERMIPDEQETYDILSEYYLDEQGNLKEDMIRRNPFDDYVISQPSPEHLMDTDASFGVQFRNLVPANLPEGTYNVNGKDYDAKEIRKHFEMLVNELMLEDFESLKRKTGNIENLQKFIKQTIWGNPKYSRSFTSAFDLIEWKDNVTGMTEKRFALPVWTPSIVKRTESLLTSLFRNNIAKRKENGGVATLKSSFLTGYNDMKIIFNKDGGIDYVECYLPAWTAKFFDKSFMGEDGLPDIDKIPEELKMFFGYRLPTEGKMSITRFKVKGFLAPEEGTSLIIPADFVTITGENFEIDKRFLAFYEFETVRKYDIKKAWDTFYKENPEIAQQIEKVQKERYQQVIDLTKENNKDNKDFNPGKLPFFKEWLPLFYEDMEKRGEKKYDLVEGTKEKFNEWFKSNNDRFYLSTELKKIEYDPSKEASGEWQDPRAVWNELLDTASAILSAKEVAIQDIRPSNFNTIKKMDRIVCIITNERIKNELIGNGVFENEMEGDWNNLFNKNLEYLDGLLDKDKAQTNSLYLTTFIENHRRNMVADRLIGMYANNLVQQAKYQNSGLRIDLGSNEKIIVNGRMLDRLDMITDDRGLLSERCSEFYAASVDAVKDPVLDGLKQNMRTVGVLNTMLRIGFTIEEAALLFNQPEIREAADVLRSFKIEIDERYKKIH